ncbi:MAG: secretion protein [Flavobacterium sp.]|uniref:T9SS type A sorting domain-containing protein n=1 Tax=unclassified Flavobacterium TaxID=196869 RepID=UPI000C548C1B|nr:MULTISPECIES: T9SS type A sorting domain-containing protein [unclassified Flavobacterium]MBF02222.1 secretion protein [Flavobacterium sp.]MCO6163247.1 T9SS type A sorting domain-containing protein [Flavobacterium sp. NRK F7]
MKSLLKLSLVFAVVLSTMTVHANDLDFLLYVKNKNGKQITFSINAIQEATITILDQEGQEIYVENAKGEKGIKKTYNLEQFPAGKYILKVENNLKKVSYEILVTDEDATLSTKGISQTYKVTMSSEKLASN